MSHLHLSHITGCGGLRMLGPHRLMCLTAWPTMVLLEGVASLEYLWPCWRKCITVGSCFEVIYDLAIINVAHSVLLLPKNQDIKLSVTSM